MSKSKGSEDRGKGACEPRKRVICCQAIDYHHYVRGEIGSDRLDLSCLQESWGMTLPDVQLQGLY